jgi:chromosomal replication initiation ATPase DnaA
MSNQLILPLGSTTSFSREDFVVAPANREAVAFVDSWPNWPGNVAALYGPTSSGKSHLASTWKADPQIVQADALSGSALARVDRTHAVVVENVGSATTNPGRDAAIFSLIESASPAAPVLLTGHEPPSAWPVTLPDLASRYQALLAFPLWVPDEALLKALTHKLFADRQLAVPDAVVARMLAALERSPGAIRDFVARADARSLAEKRPITTALIQDMLD